MIFTAAGDYNKGDNVVRKDQLMPREDRQLIFDYDEVYQALRVLCAKSDKEEPVEGALMEVRVHKDDKQRILLKVVNHKKNLSQDLEYSLDFLAAALMLYCRENYIPLPKDARKLVQVSDHSVTLRIMI